MGLGKIDDALLEFRRVLHLDPNNTVAKDHLKKLEREREKLVASQPKGAPVAVNDGATMVMTPEEAAAQAAAPPVKAPAPPPKAEAKPAPKPEAKAPAKPAPPPKPAAAPKPAGAKKGGLPMPALAGIIAGVIVIAVAAIFLLNRQPGAGATDTAATDEPVATSTETPGTGTTPVVEPPPVTPPVPAPALTPAQAESVKAVATRAKAVRDSIAAVKAAAKAALAAATPVAPVAGDATVIVTASPFANFTVDGQAKTQNAKSWRGKLAPGKHTVVVEHPTLGKQEWSLDLAAGETKELSYDFLAAAAGTINVTAEGGWAEIYLDGDKIGHPTPWVITGVLPGKHEISLVREGWTVDGGAKTVTVKAGQEAKVSFKVKAKK